MKPCAEYAPLIAERASGPVDPAEAARVARHLDACDACRAEAVRIGELLDRARVPGAGALEEREAAALPRRLAAAARRPLPAPPRWALALAAGLAVAVVAVPVELYRLRAAVRSAPAVALSGGAPRGDRAVVASSDGVTDADALADTAWELSNDAEADVLDQQ